MTVCRSWAGWVWLCVTGLFCTAVAAAPTPVVTVDVSDAAPFIGENVTFTVTFDNTGAPTEVGYGPFLDVVLPVNGADGAAGADTPDGLDFISASYLGSAVTSTVLTFPDADGAGPGGVGCVDHPYAVDATDTPEPVCGAAGDKLIVVQLPFGSFVTEQPPAPVAFSASMSNLADLGVALTIRARGGFQFGADPVDNPAVDPSIVSDAGADSSLWSANAGATPSLIRLTKTGDEGATGPNYPRRYVLDIQVAPGQTVTDLDISDALPTDIVYLGVSAPGAAVTDQPAIGQLVDPADNVLNVNYAALSGNAQIDLDYYVAEADFDGAPVIGRADGDNTTTPNTITALGDWAPIDGRDAVGVDTVTAAADFTRTDQSMVTAKAVALALDADASGGLSPGDALEYTVSVAVADYFAFNTLVIADTFSDGQRLDGSFSPTLTATQHGSTSSGAFDAANITVDLSGIGNDTDPVTDGGTTLTFRVSDELLAREPGRHPDGRVLGGCMPAAGTDPGAAGAPTTPPADCAIFDAGATTLSIVFRTVVQEQFSDTYLPENPSVDQGDQLDNQVSASGVLLSVANFAPHGNSEADEATASIALPRGELTKSIYAINGDTGFTTPIRITSGDTVTYRLHYTLPTANVEDLILTDFLPLPVFDATTLTGFDPTVSAAAPPAGTVKFGAGDSFFARSGIVPTLAIDADANSASLDYGDYNDTSDGPEAIELLLTVRTQPEPFVDGLFLTNQVQTSEGSTNAGAATATTVVQLQLTEPLLSMGKGIVAADSAGPVFSPATVGPVAFSAPGGGCPRFVGVVDSQGLAATPIDSDLAGADAGDTVSFAIVVENTGSGVNGAFDVRVRDSLPTGFSIPGGGLNLCVTDGSGAVIPHVNVGGGSGLFDQGIELTDPGPTPIPSGALDTAADTGGRNLAVITYDLVLEATVAPRQPITNTTTLFNYSGEEGGADFTLLSDQSDDGAVTSIAHPGLAKTLDSLAPGGAGGGDLAAGDVVTYRITVTLPEGQTPDLTLTDTLPAGFAYLAGSVAVDTTGFVGVVDTSPSVTTGGTVATGQTVTLDFDSPATTVVTVDNNSANNTFAVTLQARVEGAETANDGLPAAQAKTNAVALDFTDNPAAPLTASAAADFVEPELAIIKVMTPDTGLDAGDTVTVTLTVRNNGTGPAYDIQATDTLNDNGDLFDLASVAEGATPAGYTFSYANPTVSYAADPGTSLAAGDSVSFTFTAQVRADVITGSSFGNTAAVSGDSQDGAVTGERSSADTDTDTATVATAGVDKTLGASSESFSSDSAPLQAAIGEVLTFQAVYTLPEGLTQDGGANAIITDTLPTGLAYLADIAFLPGTATIRAVADTGISGSLYGPIPGAANLINPTVNGQVLEFDLGDLTNSDNDADSEQLILTYDVLVLNTTDNNRADTKTNTAQLTYLNRSGNPQVLSDTETLRIGEPNPSITKTASPATVSVGDTVTFTVVFGNQAGADVSRAWEPEISDTLPNRYGNLQLVSATLSRGSVDLAGCVTVAALTISLDSNCLAAAERYLDPGETITLVYTATLASSAAFNEQITNTAVGRVSSLPGSNGTGGVTPGAPGSSTGERLGSGLNNELGQAVNGLTAQDSATITAGRPTLTKTGDTALPVGGVATMTLTVDLPTGNTASLVVTDDLPTGLVYTGDPITITLPGANFSATNSPSTSPGVGADPLVFDFGAVTNSAASAQSIVIAYPVRVANVAANQNAVTLTNTATLSFTGAAPPLPTDAATVTVIEPDLEIVKTLTAGASGSDAGDTVSFQVVVSNTSPTATAFRVDLQDPLPPELLGNGGGPFFLAIALVNPGDGVRRNSDGLPLSAGDAQFITTTETDDTLTWPLFDLPPLSALTITYDAVIRADATAGSVLSNRVDAAYHSLADGAGTGRDGNDLGSDDDDDSDLDNYNETDSAALTLAAGIAIQKTLDPGQPDAAFTIGETASFDLRVDLVEGVTNAVVVTDLLPTGLSYMDPVSIIAGPHISYAGPGLGVEAPAGTITVNLGDVTNSADADPGNDFLIVRLQAQVDDLPGNVQGVVLSNSASVSADQGSAGPDTQDLTVVEPVLTVTKTPDQATPSLGDPVTFTVTVRHAPGSGADAFDVVLDDPLPAGLSYIPGSTLGVAVDETDPARPVFQVGVLTLAAMETDFSFQARVDPDAAVGQTLTNTLGLAYDGLSGEPTVERDYTGAGSGDVTPGAAAFLDAVKTVDLVVDGATAGQVDPGDTLEYTVVLTNAGPAASNVVFTDVLPQGLSYVANSLTTSVGTVDDSAAPQLRVAVGGLAPAAGVIVGFRATVDADVVPGTVINNQGQVDSDQTVAEPTDLDGVDGNGDQPTPVSVGGGADLDNPLYAEKRVIWIDDADADAAVSPGDTLAYTLVLRNRGGSDLTNPSLADTLPEGLAFRPGTASSSVGTLNVTGGSVAWTGIPSLAPDSFAIARFEVTIDAPLFDADADPATERFVNQGLADSDQTDPTPTDGNASPEDGYQPTTISAVDGVAGAPALDLEKRVALAVDNDGDGQVDPGDTLDYRLELRNTGSAAALNLRLSDAIPAATRIVAGSVTTSQGAVVAEDPVTINLADLAAGAVATVRFQVTVEPGVADGVLIANQATVGGDNVATAPSDDNGADGDGLNPTLIPVDSGGGAGGPAGLSKAVIAHSEADSVGSQALIGEVLTFRVAVELPAGLLREAELTDTLPDGLSYLPGSARLARRMDTGLTASRNPGGINSAADGVFVALADGVELDLQGQTLGVLLGDVINSDNDADAEGYTLEYQALVANDAGNQAGTVLTNAATLGWLDALFQPRTLTPVGATVTVLEPAPQVIKSADPAALLSSGGRVSFTLTVTHPASPTAAPAYDLTLTDSLGPEWSGLTVDSIIPAGGVSGVTDASAATVVDLRVASFPVGGSLTVVYSAQASGPLAEGELLNTAALAWTSLPGDQGSDGAAPGVSGAADGERNGVGTGPNDYAAAAQATVTVGPVALDKSLSDPQTRYAIGEPVEYRLRVSLPAGAELGNGVIDEVLDPGLSYIPGSLDVVLPTGVSAPGLAADFSRAEDSPGPGQETLTLPLGDLANVGTGTATLTLDYQAQVDNQLSNQANQTLDNVAGIEFDDPGGAGRERREDTASVTVGEPHLDLAVTLIGAGAGLEAGDTVTFQVSLGNGGDTIAYDVVLAHLLPPGLESVSGLAVTAASGGAGTPVLSSNADGWNSDPFDLPPGASLSLSFSATLAAAVSPGQSIQAAVQASFGSRAGGDPHGRDGSDPGSDQDDDSELNNYNTAAAAPTFTVGDPVALDKRFYPDPTDTAYTIGESVTYRLTVALLEGTVNGLTVTDTLPEGLALDSVAVGVGHLGMTHQYTPPSGLTGRTLSIPLGQVVNPPNGQSGDDFLTLDIQARVENIPANQAGVVLGNHAALSFQGPSGTVTRDFDADSLTPGVQPLDLRVVMPELTLTKTADRERVTLGDEVAFRLRLDHAAVSGADAYDIVVADTLPEGLDYVPGSASPAPAVAGRTLTFTVAALTLAQDSTTLSYRARVAAAAPVGSTLLNSALARYSTRPGDAPLERDGDGGVDDLISGPAAAPVIPEGAVAMDAVKTVALSGDLDGDGAADPGDILEYRVRLVAPSEDLTAVVYLDRLPAGLEYVDGSLAATLGVVDDSQAPLLRVELASLAAAATVEILYRARVAAFTAAGVALSNQGLADSGQTVPEPTDADGNNSNGDQPTVVIVAGPPLSALSAAKTVALVADPVAPVGTINVGDQVRYQVTLANTGQTPITGLEFRDPLPGGLTVNAVEGGVLDGGVVQAGPLDLAPGAVYTLAITATVTLAGEFSNQGTATGAGLIVLTDANGQADDGAQPTVFTAQAAAQTGEPVLTLTKQVELLDDANGDGRVNPGETLRFTLGLANTGAAPATGLSLRDPLPGNATLLAGSVSSSQGAVVAESPELVVNLGTLPPGGLATVSLVMTVSPTAGSGEVIANQATARDDQNREAQAGPVTVTVAAPALFDPPSGFKRVVDDQPPDLQWQMVWINAGNATALGARITDPIPAASDYLDDSLSCEARGASTVSRCDYDPVANQVVYEGDVAPDLGATTETDAVNAVVIVYRTTVSPAVAALENQGCAQWDADGDGFVGDQVAEGQEPVCSDDPDTAAAADPTRWTRRLATPTPARIPALSPVGLVLLALVLAWLGGRRLGRGGG